MNNWEELRLQVGSPLLEIYARYIQQQPGKLCLLILHDLGEHSQFYLRWQDTLEKWNIPTYVIDLPGHGESEGQLSQLSDMSLYGSYLAEAIERILDHSEQNQLLLLGIGLGATLGFQHLRNYPDQIAGYAVISALLGLPVGVVNLSHLLERVITRFYPTYPISYNWIDILPFLDSEEKKQMKEQFSPRSKYPYRWFVQLERLTKRIQAEPQHLSAPTLFIHGGKDLITPQSQVREFFRNLNAVEKKFISFSESGHYLLYEEDDQISILMHNLEQFFHRFV